MQAEMGRQVLGDIVAEGIEVDGNTHILQKLLPFPTAEVRIGNIHIQNGYLVMLLFQVDNMVYGKLGFTASVMTHYKRNSFQDISSFLLFPGRQSGLVGRNQLFLLAGHCLG